MPEITYSVLIVVGSVNVVKSDSVLIPYKPVTEEPDTVIQPPVGEEVESVVFELVLVSATVLPSTKTVPSSPSERVSVPTVISPPGVSVLEPT